MNIVLKSKKNKDFAYCNCAAHDGKRGVINTN